MAKHLNNKHLAIHTLFSHFVFYESSLDSQKMLYAFENEYFW